MQDEKSRSEPLTPTKEDAEQEATSKETVSDLKGGDEISRTETDNSSGAGNSSTPSPDGQFDGAREGSGPGEESGPM